jgi:hypothetical protein
MSKKCGHSIPCGCKDTALTTGAPCGEGIDCTGNPCAENFCADCILWCGPGLPNLGITQGMPLSDIIQIIEITQSSDISCVDTSDSCKSVLWGSQLTSTSTSININWSYIDPLQTADYTLTYGDGVSNTVVTLTPGSTSFTIENLIPNKLYYLAIDSTCASEPDAPCSSALITIKTLIT